MRHFRIRCTLGELMALVAAVALTYALVPAPVSVAFSIVLVVFAVAIAVVASVTSASRLGVAVWMFSLYPVLPLASLYATWFTAWAVLGHPPRASLDDPEFISPVVDVPYSLTFLFLEGSVPALAVSALLSVAVMFRSAWRLTNAARSAPHKRLWVASFPLHFLVPLASWFLAYTLFVADPLGVLFWYMD